MTLRRIGFTAVPPGPKPGFDHADVYLSGGVSRLYVAHTGADRVDVLDCSSGGYLRALGGLPGVAGALIDSAQDLPASVITLQDAASSQPFPCQVGRAGPSSMTRAAPYTSTSASRQ